MQYTDYNKLSIRTLPNLQEVYNVQNSITDRTLDTLHMILGMTSELTELDKAIVANDKVNIAEELTDIVWYVSGYKYVRGILAEFEFEPTFMHLSNGKLAGCDFLDLTSAISELSDAPKKYLAYKRPINLTDELNNYINLLVTINNVAVELDVNLELSMEQNINKLKVRFPDKFDFDKAQEENRDRDRERKELENKNTNSAHDFTEGSEIN